MNHSFISNLDHFAVIQVEGEKAETFLQGQLTCDIREVTEHQTRFAAICSPKGRILISARAIKLNQQFYLIVLKQNAEFAIQHLKKYAMLSRVQLNIVSELVCLGIAGETISEEFSEKISTLPEGIDQTKNFENDSILFREHGEHLRYILCGNKTTLDNILNRFSNYFESNIQYWKNLDFETALAQVYPETRDIFTPHMLNFPQFNAVSFKKGCYIGQEIIARTHYLGRTKRQLQKATVALEAQAKCGDLLVNEQQQEVGTIAEAIDAENQQLLLTVLQEDAINNPIFLKNHCINLLI